MAFHDDPSVGHVPPGPDRGACQHPQPFAADLVIVGHDGVDHAGRLTAAPQLLVQSTLLSAPISADIVMAAARELFAAG